MLSEVMAQAVHGLIRPDAKQVKLSQRLVDKLKFCKEVLTNIRNASAEMEEGEKKESVGR